MVRNNDVKLYKKALELKGEIVQIDIAIEEAAEFIQSLIKVKRVKEGRLTRKDAMINVAEEAADLSIMIDQMLVTFNIEKEFLGHKKRKLKRLKTRLELLKK